MGHAAINYIKKNPIIMTILGPVGMTTLPS